MMKTSSNESILTRLEKELPESSGYFMLIAIVAAYAWTIYLTYYNSRVLGLIITAIINKLARYGHIKLGSFSFSLLSGKVMFRDVHLVTEDFSIRVQYGWLIFRWWRPYVYKELTEDLSHMETRMSLFLEGFEFHVYNKSKVYERLERIFRGETDDISQTSPPPDTSKAKGRFKDIHWRDLIPVTKIEISSGRWVFGNYLMPYSCLLKFDKCNMVYTTKPASTVFDKFMHILKCDLENTRIMLVPSPKYNGPVQDEPPRFMGEGFVVMLSNHVEIYYYQDEPGIVQHELEQIQMADGEVLVKRTFPCIGVDIKCGKNTDFNYGPWVDRQRELIWSFFFPPDYQSLLPTKRAQPGEKRQFKSLEVKMTINAISAIDILFTKNSITHALHMNAGKGSYIEVTVPYIIEDDGYMTKVKGQLMLVDATTSMPFRSLLECETLEFDVTAKYPREWNACQDWCCDFTACKALVYLIYDLKQFFSDLVGDWSSKSAPDLYTFVPYTWTLNLTVKQFEILTLANENNWVDTSSQHQENAHIAFCGEVFELCVTFPFSDFVPETVPVQLLIKGDTVFCRLYLPESNTMKHVVIALSENIRVVDREGHVTCQPFVYPNKKEWRNVTLKSNGWVDCWQTNYVFLSVTYTYFPMPVIKSTTEPWDQFKEDLEEGDVNLLEQPASSGVSGPAKEESTLFDPGDLKPDFIQVELEVSPSTLVLYGSLLRNLINLKENYLGEFQKATDYEESQNKMKEVEASYVHLEAPDDEEVFDYRMYRPFAVTVSVTLHDIQAHLAKNCTSDDQPCPSAYVERLCFELDKSFRETKLQLLLSPCVLLAKDGNSRDTDQEHLKDGHLALSGLQVRGHAMFSLEGLPLDYETLEYAWLIEVIVGELTGKLTTPQVQNVAEFLQTFIMMVENAENKLQSPITHKMCQHIVPQHSCYETKNLPFPCPSSEDIKYEMSRFSVDFVNIFLVEPCSALNIQVHPVRIANCNLHGPSTRAGITGMIERVELKQYVCGIPSKTNLQNWLEAGGFSLGPIMLEAAVALAFVQLCQIQNKFLKVHDAKTKRLWFLWNESELLSPIHSSVYGKCGCLGGCAFFGKNKNGISFFKLKRHRDGTQVVAIPQVCKDGSDPGFGQSLLHAGKLVFETSQLTLRVSPVKAPADVTGFSFTRGYMSELTSPVGDEDGNLIMRPKETPTEDMVPKSALSDTQMLMSGFRQEELRRLSKESVLTRQSSLPSADKISALQHHHSIENRKSSRKKLSKVHSNQTSPSNSKPRSAVSSDLTLTGHYQTSSASSMSPANLRRLMSKASMESDIYYTANEADDSDLESGSGTLTWEGARRGMFSDDESCPSTVKRLSQSQSMKERDRRKPKDGNRGFVSATSSVSSLASTLSYCSATSDNDSEMLDSQVDPEELIDMINLHSHMNLPITQSPLLLSCYSQHLSHYICQDWTSSAPWNAVYTSRIHGLNSVQSEYSLSSAGHSVYSAGVAWTPHFVKVKDGFSVNVMKPRQDAKKSPPTNITADLYNIKATLDREHKKQMLPNQDTGSPADNISKTTAVIQLSGSLDVLMTPLLLEALQRYVEAVTPTLSKLHPSALIDGLHSQCLDRLKQQNKLKKDKEWSQNKTEDSFDNTSTELSPAKKTSLQALFTLPKVNICVLQASIVEEVIAFSSLSSASDLTAVSLLAVCIDGVRCQLLSNKHLCQITKEPAKEQLTRKTSVTVKMSAKASSGHKGKVEVHPSEPDIEKPQELTREENVGTLQISHIHVQLRRLLKFSNFSENVLLTAIPEQCSRVLFSLEQDTAATQPIHVPESNLNVNNFMSSSPRPRLSRTASRDKETEFVMKNPDGENSNVLPNIGFIMCESGLEDISFTAVRRLGYQEVTDVQLIEEKLSTLDKTVTQMQEKARSKVEGDKAETNTDEEPKKSEPKEKAGRDMGSRDSSTDEPYPLSSPSANVQSSSLSSPSWDSDKSVVSSEIIPGTPGPLQEPIVGDASNGKLEIKIIWFNFASPPPISIHKKVDFTRLDWNLLSTATPAIDAWLNPCDRLMTSVKNLIREYSKRLCCVMACMMIEGLECQGIHVAYKSKFNKLTPLSKTLQEDPSNQLLTVLRKYLHKFGIEPVEKAVSAETVPQLITVQKGILALMRQWKNVLYMPNLGEINFKSRKNLRPYNVSFALPKSEKDEEVGEEEEMTFDQFDVVDEKTSLLLAEGGITQRSGSFQSVNSKSRQSLSTQGKMDKTDGGDTSIDSVAAAGKHRVLGIFRPRKGITTTDSPVDYSSSNLAPPVAALFLNRNDSNVSFTSLLESVSSNEQLVVPTPPQTPLRSSAPKQSILKNRYNENENLYQWMAKQQNSEFRLDLEDNDSHQYHRTNAAESCPAGLASSWNQDDSKLDVNEDNCTMATSIMQLADAQILFKPILQSLGLHVESVRPSAMMKKFGGHLLLQCHINLFKILIAESEGTPTLHKEHVPKGKGPGKKTHHKLTGNPAFLCECFDMKVSLKDAIIDASDSGDTSKFPYKFAMHKLEAKPTTLKINLLVNCQAIRQNVDMALLRLAHQVLTMVSNVKQTRVELKQKKVDPQGWIQTHRKQDSKDSTSSMETNQSDTSQTERLMGSFTNLATLDSTKSEIPIAHRLSPPSTSKPPLEIKSSLTPVNSSSKLDLKLMTGAKYSPQVTSKMAHTQTSSSKLGSDTLNKQTQAGEGQLDSASTPLTRHHHTDTKRPEELAVDPGKKPAHLRFLQDTKEPAAKKVISPHSESDVLTPPHSLNLSDSVVLDMADTSSPALNEKTIIDEIKESTPQCWRHLYQLLELYATMPEPKTVAMRHSQVISKLPVIEEEEGEEASMKRESRVSDYGNKLTTLIQKSSVLHGLRRDSSSESQDAHLRWKNDKEKILHPETLETKAEDQKNKADALAKEEESLGNDSSLAHQSFIRTRFKQSIYVGESVPVIVYGILRVETFLISAELSGLKLEAHTSRVHASGTYKKKVKGFLHRVSSDSSYTAHIGQSKINLREGEPPELQTVVTINIHKSQALLTSVMRRGKEHNSTLVSIGVVEIDIPQHPVILHDMMSRSSKRITATLQELRWPAQSTNRMQHSSDDNSNQSAANIEGASSKLQHQKVPQSGTGKSTQEASKTRQKHLHIKAVLQGFMIGASILPSLKAQYKTTSIILTGVLGRKAHFTLTLPNHLLSFKSKINVASVADTSIPSAASIDLPPIQVIADYRMQKPGVQDIENQLELGEDLQLLEGNYLNAVAEVGMLEHSLTTDLLNHLVFVQKVFMKEINEIVQKVSGSNSINLEDIKSNLKSEGTPETTPMLYSVSVRFKGIQVTATTPTSNAVRFETGAIKLDLSNRFHLPKKEEKHHAKTGQKQEHDLSSQKMFIQAIVDLNLALGQLLKNPVYEETEPEFHTMAFFKTTIKIRNALQHEMIPNFAKDQEALLINLSRPIILAQPLAFDKAVLVWLNYKNAYEYWTEQRMALNKEVLTATRQVIDKLPHIAPSTAPSVTTLFLQLTVDDMGICVPLLSSPYQSLTNAGGATLQSPRVAETEQGSALVLTVENTQISACSSGSLVSKGKFKNFCLRFADDFGSSWDDWKPWPTDSGPVMNQCNVPSGTYEVCSRTINKQDTASGNAKWILNVQWDMKGIGVHLDTDIGKRFTLLGNTLTLLAGETDEGITLAHTSKHGDDIDGEFDENDDEDVDLSSPDTQENSLEDLQLKRRTSLASDILPEEIFSEKFDPKERARKIEREMNEQAKVVQELKECGATEATIEIERKKLEDLQALLFQDFRRDLLEMLKRKGDKASLIKGKLGLSSKPSTHLRPKSPSARRLAKSSSDRHPSSTSALHIYKSRRQSEDLSKITKVSFSGSHLNTYTPPNTPGHFSISDDEEEDDEDSDPFYPHKRGAHSLEAVQSSGSDSQPEEGIPRKRKLKSDDSASVTSNKVSEQNVDFELDVKVFIDSGQCVLYSKEAKEEEVRKYAKKEKQGASDSNTQTSPSAKRKLKKETSGQGYSSQRKLSANPDTTIFFIPSVAVKIHYNSKTDHTASMNNSSTIYEEPAETVIPSRPYSFIPEITVTSPLAQQSTKEESTLSLDSGSPRRSTQLKKASLYALFTLQTLPEEMIISPTLLDFLEQALEPLPITANSSPSILKRDVMDSLVNNMDLDASQGSLGQQSMAFFPVDVVVHIKVDPSFIRFNCHPVSRVECLLQVPSLDLFFSTKKTDLNEGMQPDSAQTPKSSSQFEKKAKVPSSSNISSQAAGRSRHISGISESSFFPGSSSGGLSVTGCMSDFSLYIFHPYGTGVQRRFAANSDSPTFRNQGLERISENTGSAIHDMGRRDSLSLNVEFIKVNISRTRKLERYSEPNENPAKGEQQFRSNIVRFSAICDVGTASFKYDMRRLSEILSLPKAWYRRTLARRLFLGDESINLAQGEGSSRFHTSGSLASRDSGHRKKSRTVSSPDMPHHRHSFAAPTPAAAPPSASVSSSWETLVLFAVNLAQLNLEVNMANVMGNTEWKTKALKTQGRLSINSKGHKNLNIDAGFGKSSFESKGGIVGGNIDINNLNGFFSVCEDPELGQDPDHQAGLSTSALETKIDYMGSSIIMTRLSNLHLLLKDEWHVDSNSNLDTPLATNRSAFLFVNGKLSWSHFHMMISRSTTPDLIKIISKLDEFFTQQVMSGRRVFQHTTPLVAGSQSKVARKISESAVMDELRHHRHWQGALEHLMGYQFSMLPSVLPAEGMVLGGTMILEGQGLMLASFHGVNFRAKYWALFNIKDPYIYFSTEAQKIPEGGTHIVQDLQFIVGQQQGAQSTGFMAPQVIHNHMATICKISRTQHMPPNFTCVDDWFTYAMTSSATDPKVVTEFPGVRHDEENLRKFSKVKAAYYSHETEVIFAFPSMYMNLKTSHFQGEKPPEENEARPMVECSFVAEFYDHIYVAMDAEVILFLHDLVSSYIREKDRGSSGRSSATKVVKSEPKLSDPTSALKHDYRTFECKTWQLEPTLRLIHWASTQIDPVGADYVLQKLGFSHARVTIPKWVQRGFMDPLDKVLSVLVDKLVTALRDQQSSGSAEEADKD
ncbi:bridge-like lipid transfer protein family member 1 isoform X2 [Biomphalaria glabrata]|uniref:Bridge-like lipid transfer protein family member 1 isoform X2 n=1 Tax=Biomphalaria glabrata TaxID=6526 RepID=A0A9W3B1A0_BIOGL|nr:bridge-like lipid transfer protein family member 1 isoform X2 [Biomphalaria glabrata]